MVLSGWSAPAPLKIFRPRMEGALYLMAIVLSLMVTEVFAGGLVGVFFSAFFWSWANPRAVVAAIALRQKVSRKKSKESRVQPRKQAEKVLRWTRVKPRS